MRFFSAFRTVFLVLLLSTNYSESTPVFMQIIQPPNIQKGQSTANAYNSNQNSDSLPTNRMENKINSQSFSNEIQSGIERNGFIDFVLNLNQGDAMNPGYLPINSGFDGLTGGREWHISSNFSGSESYGLSGALEVPSSGSYGGSSFGSPDSRGIPLGQTDGTQLGNYPNFELPSESQGMLPCLTPVNSAIVPESSMLIMTIMGFTFFLAIRFYSTDRTVGRVK